MQAQYSREHEADQFGAALLKTNGWSPRLLGDMLGKLETSHRAKQQKAEDEKQDDSSSDVRDYLSSHPATKERIDALNNPEQ